MLIHTLDAGGTNLEFRSVEDGKVAGEAVRLEAASESADAFMQKLESGFRELMRQNGQATALSVAFPGPADYEAGVIFKLQNLPFIKHGFALKHRLEQLFSLPVYIQNDGNLFTLGESEFGYLPWINRKLEEAGIELSYSGLCGVTLGTGFGAGLVLNGRLLSGNNTSAAEAWLFRNKRHTGSNVEDTVSKKALQRMYAEQIFMDPAEAPEPLDIYRIARGEKEGVREAAVECWYRYGEVLGDALANMITLTDVPVVVGGGLSGAWPLFRNAMMDELNGFFNPISGDKFRRLIPEVFDTEQPYDLSRFLDSENLFAKTDGADGKGIPYQASKRIPIGLSKLGTGKAIALGAYSYASRDH